MITISKNEVRRIVGDKFFSVTFTKKNGESRKINGRLGVTHYLKGGTNVNSDKPEYLIIYEINNGYRTVNLESITRLCANGKEYIFK